MCELNESKEALTRFIQIYCLDVLCEDKGMSIKSKKAQKEPVRKNQYQAFIIH